MLNCYGLINLISVGVEKSSVGWDGVGRMGFEIHRKYNMYSRVSIRLHGSLKLGSQMSRLRQVTRQMLVYLSTFNLGILAFNC